MLIYFILMMKIFIDTRHKKIFLLYIYKNIQIFCYIIFIIRFLYLKVIIDNSNRITVNICKKEN